MLPGKRMVMRNICQLSNRVHNRFSKKEIKDFLNAFEVRYLKMFLMKDKCLLPVSHGFMQVAEIVHLYSIIDMFCHVKFAYI